VGQSNSLAVVELLHVAAHVFSYTCPLLAQNGFTFDASVQFLWQVSGSTGSTGTEVIGGNVRVGTVAVGGKASMSLV